MDFPLGVAKEIQGEQQKQNPCPQNDRQRQYPNEYDPGACNYDFEAIFGDGEPNLISLPFP